MQELLPAGAPARSPANARADASKQRFFYKLNRAALMDGTLFFSITH